MSTTVGQQIPDFFNYMADFVEQSVRSLRGGLTFSDNFACDLKTVTLKHATDQIVSASKVVVGIIPIRVVSQTTGIDSLAWWYNDAGKLTVKAGLTGAPAGTFDVSLVLLF